MLTSTIILEQKCLFVGLSVCLFLYRNQNGPTDLRDFFRVHPWGTKGGNSKQIKFVAFVVWSQMSF